MSVQAGIWNFDGTGETRPLLERFSHFLQGQGPDGEALYDGDFVGLLYRPFCTTAESRREKQPYSSQRGFVVTWDGRLDNRRDLIARLGLDLEAEPTDVAIVAAAFDRWETDCFNRIIGDWAVSVWRPKERELIFAVDYLAIRHIFYWLTRDRIWWSTDLNPLVLLSSDKFHLDDDYIIGYLVNDPDAHLTPYQEIREVPPGHFVSIRDGKSCSYRYWSFSPESRIRYQSDTDYEEHFLYLFRQSVNRRLRSDSPILAELSGGLDSSSIVCVADEILRKDPALNPRLDTISYYDKMEPHGDDWIFFQKIEAKRGRVGFHIDTSKLGSCPAPLEYPEFAGLPGYLGVGNKLEAERAECVRTGGHRAVLSGLGGDEFMGGIPAPQAQLADLIVRFKLVALAKETLAWSLVKRRPWIQLLWESVIELLPWPLVYWLAKDTGIERWVNPHFAKRTQASRVLFGQEETFGVRLPTRRSSVRGLLLIANKLSKFASPAMALEETRYPFLDRNLIEFVLSIPATQLLRPGERRSLMRRALVGYVPEEILARRTKGTGARTPRVVLETMRQEISGAFESAFSSKLGYIDSACLLETCEAAISGKRVSIVNLFKGISLELWLRALQARGMLHGDPPARSLPTQYQVGACVARQ